MFYFFFYRGLQLTLVFLAPKLIQHPDRSLVHMTGAYDW